MCSRQCMCVETAHECIETVHTCELVHAGEQTETHAHTCTYATFHHWFGMMRVRICQQNARWKRHACLHADRDIPFLGMHWQYVRCVCICPCCKSACTCGCWTGLDWYTGSLLPLSQHPQHFAQQPMIIPSTVTTMAMMMTILIASTSQQSPTVSAQHQNS